MKRFACGDVVPGCKAEWVSASEDELLEQVAAHASHEHGITTVSDELVAAVRAHVQHVDSAAA